MFKNWTPAQVLASGFLALILLGTLLLSLPFSAADGHEIGIIDALFTSASSVCVTGLIVKDTPNDFSIFGQIIIMILVQIGGLGYMTASTVIALLLGKRIGLRERLIMREGLNVLSLEGLIRFTRMIVWVTLCIEGIAAGILFLRFSYDFSYPRAIYLGVFHSITSFNNAGFALFSDNLTGYRSDLTVNLVVMGLIIIGGAGFIIFSDLFKYFTRENLFLSLHTKLTLSVMGFLTVGGALLLFFFEMHNSGTMAGLPFKEKALMSLFHSVSARTAGFNTINIGSLANDSLFILIILMVIGASPGSTGGGIKTTTFGVMIAALWATMLGRQDNTVFRRRLPMELIARAFLLTTLVSIIIIAVTTTLLLTENKSVTMTLFEVASAFGTVGLSVGDGGVLSLSALFSTLGKLIITATMYIGRVGPLLLSMAIMGHAKPQRFRYPEERVLLG